MEFYSCKECKNIIIYAYHPGANTLCCGNKMEKMVANTTDAAKEKHVPVIAKDGNKINVKVGSAAHPMEADHYITFIAIETKQGYQVKNLKPGDKPEADFVIADGDSFVAAYEYCNKHGLWKAE